MVDLKNRVNERSLAQKPYHVCFNLHELPRIGQCVRTESRLVDARGSEYWGTRTKCLTGFLLG